MFIHWGLYSIPAGTWNGKQVPGIGEWIMNRGTIPVADYKALASKFNPTGFNAHDIVALAKAAGMKYIVITSKHHDGFAMFDSKADPFNIVDATPFHRDPIKELAEECRKQGIKLGFYYSQDQDWTAPGGAAYKTGNHDRPNHHWDPAQDGNFAEYLHKKAIPQLKELLSNYGEFPAVIWFDTPTDDMTPELAGEIVDIAQPASKSHLEQSSRRRLQGRYGNSGAVHPRQGLSRAGLGSLHDDERHVGLQVIRHKLQVHRDSAPQSHRHRQQRWQLPTQHRA